MLLARRLAGGSFHPVASPRCAMMTVRGLVLSRGLASVSSPVRDEEGAMGQTNTLLDEVRAEIAPSDETLRAARARRQLILDAAKTYPGFLRSYMSGSIAHGTANGDTDADCGIVLDRRTYPALGPDGDDEGPSDIVESVRSHLRDALREDHADVSFRVTKRAVMVKFNDPIAEDIDPHVDMIVALNRRDKPGLWIPNTETDGWDASDPETHTSLLTAGTRTDRAIRARAVRLAKAWNNQYSKPGLCSFNIEALALAALEDGESDLAQALAVLFSHAASDLRRRLTPDPAGVSSAIKLKLDRDVVVGRLDKAATNMTAALEADDGGDSDAVQDALANIFWNFVDAPAASDSKAATAQRLRGDIPVGLSGSSLVGASGAVKPLKTTRAFGKAHDV